MVDFADFRTQARAEFPDLNISVMIYEEETATGSGPTMYRLKAAGMPIGPAPLTAAASPSEAITALRRLVGPARRARRAHRTSCEAAAVARHRASNPTPAPRPMLTSRRPQPVTS